MVLSLLSGFGRVEWGSVSRSPADQRALRRGGSRMSSALGKTLSKAFSVASFPKQVCRQSAPDSFVFMYVFQRTFISALLPEQSTKMQPVSLHSLSELERASLRELALYQLQKKLLVGDLSLAKGRGWERMAYSRGGLKSESLVLLPHTPAFHNVA